MAHEEIVEKLNRFITDHNPVTEECQAVYIMVEIRKILDYRKDHWRNGEFTLLRFYCDWMVHTEKEAITDSMRDVMTGIFNGVKSQIEEKIMIKGEYEVSPVMKFAYMEELRIEVKRFLEAEDINLELVDDGWVPFVQNFVKVLENQSVINPTEDIAVFSFLPAAQGCVRGIIKFKEKIGKYDHYKFGNAY